MHPLKFILAPVGSAGDVLPLVWLGRILRACGHEVVFVAQEMVRDMPERAGFRTIAWGNLAEQEAILRNPDIWHPRKALAVITEFAGRLTIENMRAIEPEIEPGRTVMVAGALAFGARVLREKMGAGTAGLITVQLQPTVFLSADDPALMMARGEWLAHVPRWLRRILVAIAHRRVDQLLGPAVEEARLAQGLAPSPGGRMRGVMREYWHSPDGVLCLFPDWFARKAGDWPKQAVLTRFPHYDQEESRPLDAELLAFLDRYSEKNRRPVVITPGSANAHARDFLQQAADACRRLNRPAVIVTRFPEQAPASAGTGYCEQIISTYAPFSVLFPRAAAVIHHGGVGTTSQCFAAGVPHLIMPLAHDQPDNGARLKKMGVGDYLYPRGFRAGKVAQRLGFLLRSPAVQESCAAVREKCRRQMAEQDVAACLEALASQALKTSAIVHKSPEPSPITA